MHGFLENKDQFSMKYFKLGIAKKIKPTNLDLEEEKFIQKCRSKIQGLHRIVVVKKFGR